MPSRNVIEILIKATNDAQLKGAFKDLKENYMNIRMAVGDAMKIAQQFYDFAIVKTVDYAKSVRDLSQNLNISTEEASRLIQVADDYGISVDQISNSLEMMTKNGVAPSIEALAELADKFNATNDPTERAAMASKLLGRNWTTLTPILLQGGDALRKQAAAVNSALVLTEEQVQASRDFEIAQDNLNDQISVLSTTMGNRAIPALTGMLNITNALIEKMGEKGLAGAWSDLTVAAAPAAIDLATKAFFGMGDAAESAAKSVKGLADATQGLVVIEEKTSEVGDDLTQRLVLNMRADIANTKAIESHTTALQADMDAAKREADAFDILNFALNGIDDATASQVSQLQDLQAAQADIEAQIQTAISQGYSPLGSKIQDLNQKLADNKQAQLDAKDAIAQTTAEMIYQQAAAGLDAEAALELARSMGVISESDYVIAKVLEDLKNQYLAGKISAEQYAAKIAELNARVAEAQSKNVTITYDLLWNGEPPPGAGGGGGGGGHTSTGGGGNQMRQAGGPVYPWQSYTVGEAGPEMFRPATAGNIIPNSQITGGDVNVTLHVYNPATAAVAMAQIRSLRSARINASMGV